MYPMSAAPSRNTGSILFIEQVLHFQGIELQQWRDNVLKPGACQFFDAGFLVSKRISFSISDCRYNSVFPAGNLLALSMKARTSESCWRVRLPGLACGMVLRMRSNKSPSVKPFQFA